MRDVRDHGLGSWPDRLARRTPNAVALIHDGRCTTFGELAARTRRRAGELQARGVRRGDRVAYLGGNRPELLETLFACGRLGAAFLPLNTRLAAAELAGQLADADPAIVLHDDDRAGLAAAATGGTAIALVAVGPAPAPGVQLLDLDIGHDEPAVLMYTSGTTGVAKGVVLTHGNLIWNALDVVVDVDLHAGEVALIVSPLFHAAALCMNSLPVLLKGGALVLAASAAPEEMLRLIARHRVTHLQGVPTIYQALVDHPGWAAADLSSVRRASSGGSAAPETLIRTYLERGVEFAQGYGMTETGPGACFLPPGTAMAKVGSVGVPMFFTDVRVVDERGGDVPPGTPGEVLVSGPNVSPGYWRRPEATAAATTEDGWYHSGDLAVPDADGYLRIVDRLKDMYISGGENVYPAEVELALQEHPGVADCAVIAVPDERWGEVGRAVVVAAEGATVDERDLIAFVGQRLARYKLPKSVVVVDDLPRTAYGKVRKAELRARYAQPTCDPVAQPTHQPHEEHQ